MNPNATTSSHADRRLRGLRARGGYEVDLAWKEGRLSQATVRSTQSGKCRLRTSAPVTVTSGGQAVRTREAEKNVIEWQAARNGVYEITPVVTSHK